MRQVNEYTLSLMLDKINVTIASDRKQVAINPLYVIQYVIHISLMDGFSI